MYLFYLMAAITYLEFAVMLLPLKWLSKEVECKFEDNWITFFFSTRPIFFDNLLPNDSQVMIKVASNKSYTHLNNFFSNFAFLLVNHYFFIFQFRIITLNFSEDTLVCDINFNCWLGGTLPWRRIINLSTENGTEKR